MSTQSSLYEISNVMVYSSAASPDGADTQIQKFPKREHHQGRASPIPSTVLLKKSAKQAAIA